MQFAICNDAFLRLAACLLVALTLAAPAFAADEKPAKDASLDELLNIPTAPKKPVESAKPGETAPPQTPDQSKPPEGITEGTHPSGEPFAAAIAEMKQAAGKLESQDPGINTQRLQEQVIRRLDQLISDARKQKKDQKKSDSRQQDQGEKENQQQSQAKAGKPEQANDSNSRATDSQKAEEARPKDSIMAEKLAEWGNLPPRLRDQLLQGMDDRYSQVYREMTEKYYRRLAEQNR